MLLTSTLPGDANTNLTYNIQSCKARVRNGIYDMIWHVTSAKDETFDLFRGQDESKSFGFAHIKIHESLL